MASDGCAITAYSTAAERRASGLEALLDDDVVAGHPAVGVGAEVGGVLHAADLEVDLVEQLDAAGEGRVLEGSAQPLVARIAGRGRAAVAAGPLRIASRRQADLATAAPPLPGPVALEIVVGDVAEELALLHAGPAQHEADGRLETVVVGGVSGGRDVGQGHRDGQLHLLAVLEGGADGR